MKNSVKKVDDSSFTQTISKGRVLVDFSAEWCGPCKMLNPILESLAAKISDKVTIVKMDVDESPRTTQQFQITSVPTLILFDNNVEIQRVVGLKDEPTLEKIILQGSK